MNHLIIFVSHYWYLCALFALILIGLIIMEAWEKFSGRFMISVDELVALSNQARATIIDIRPESQFLSGHIPNSISIPKQTFDQKVNTLKNEKRFKSKPIILVCEKGKTALQLRKQFLALGLSPVLVLKDGLQAYREAQFVLVSGLKTPR